MEVSSKDKISSFQLNGIRSIGIDAATNEHYRIKCKKLKKMIKGIVYENAALCDEVTQVQEKILIAKEDRRFLLKKLMMYLGIKDGAMQGSLQPSSGLITSSQVLTASSTPSLSYNDSGDMKTKKKNPVKKKATRDACEDGVKIKPKKKKTATDRPQAQVPSSSAAQPIFPVLLGDLTVYCLGEIKFDRPEFQTESFVYPAGYCSSRCYASMKNPRVLTSYTCTVTDDGKAPKFQIIAEDFPDYPLVGITPSECHNQLLMAINKACGQELLCLSENGEDFFGLSHPTVMSLIQNSAFAAKGPSYQWPSSKFTVHHSVGVRELDPTITFGALQQLFMNQYSTEVGNAPMTQAVPLSSMDINVTSAIPAASPSLQALLLGGSHKPNISIIPTKEK
ncbi:transforming growth factor beta regulator 1 [Tachypleus tridentatus]|uniref:transforming growth factor beta regulator 1 n=1 Tax=Tachypleus tridentatus TaxID=6853 RepID=UPI003FD188FC